MGYGLQGILRRYKRMKPDKEFDRMYNALLKMKCKAEALNRKSKHLSIIVSMRLKPKKK